MWDGLNPPPPCDIHDTPLCQSSHSLPLKWYVTCSFTTKMAFLAMLCETLSGPRTLKLITSPNTPLLLYNFMGGVTLNVINTCLYEENSFYTFRSTGQTKFLTVYYQASIQFPVPDWKWWHSLDYSLILMYIFCHMLFIHDSVFNSLYSTLFVHFGCDFC